MFVRIKKSGKYKYLQVVRNERVWSNVYQIVIGNMGRLDLYLKDDNLSHVIQSLIKIKAKSENKKKPKKRPHRKPTG